MQDLLTWLFSSTGFMPHGHCYLWQPGTLWLNVGSDALIAAAYFAIPFTIYHFVRQRRPDLPFHGILLMFAAFILLCGSTHIMEIWTVWHPDYRAAGALKALTGIVSAATMLALFRIMPRAIQLRGPTELQREVEVRTAELAALNARLRVEIASRDAAEVKLREQDQRKDQYLATLAHELRNPLAPIRQAVKLLSAEGADAAQQSQGRAVIDRQVRHMGLLLDDLLDISRITRGRLTLKKERVQVSQLIEVAVETARPAIDEKAHQLSVQLPATPVAIDADPLRLAQAVSNLLLNAAKFTPPCGGITVTVTTTVTHLVIRVSDTGIGFDPTAASSLFQTLAPNQPAADGAGGGLGIGLSLVKGLVQLHGGTVSGESRGHGLGAEFALMIPAPILDPEPPAPPSPVVLPQPAAPRARILIVDDNVDAADTLGLLLSLSGHEVAVAHGGRQALTLCREKLPAIAIIDIGMPDISGYDVARAIRREAQGRVVFLMALTGRAQSDDVARAREAGFDHHLTKPADPDRVQAILGNFLTAARA